MAAEHAESLIAMPVEPEAAPIPGEILGPGNLCLDPMLLPSKPRRFEVFSNAIMPYTRTAVRIYEQASASDAGPVIVSENASPSTPVPAPQQTQSRHR